MPNTDFQYKELFDAHRASMRRMEEREEAWRKKGLVDPSFRLNSRTGKMEWYGYDANGKMKFWNVDHRSHPVSPHVNVSGTLIVACTGLAAITLVGLMLAYYASAPMVVAGAILLLAGIALSVAIPWVGVPFLIVVIAGLVKAISG